MIKSSEFDFPEGWTTERLETVASINPRHSTAFDDSMSVTFLAMPAISESGPDFDRSIERPLSEVRKGYTHFAEGDVLFAKITPCMENGKGAVAKGLKNGVGCGTTELHVIRPCNKLNPDFLYRYLQQQSVRSDAAANFTGSAGQLRVPTSFISNLQLPIPPLAEQRRIVAKLEELLGKVSSSQQRLSRVPSLLKRFRQSVLAAACSGRLTADWREENPDASSYDIPLDAKGDGFDDGTPKSWSVTTLRTLIKLVTSGSRGWAAYYAKNGSVFVRAQNISRDILDLEDVAYVQLPNKAEGLRTKVLRDDILITITGANVAKSALVNVELEDAYVSQHVALVRLFDPRLAGYLFHWITSVGHGRKQLLESAYGQGKPGLNLDNIRDVRVAIPPLTEQSEIVCRVEKLFAFAAQIEARLKQAQTHIDRLTQSILAKAFRGELVPTEAELARRDGRNYEPASVILEQIQNQIATPSKRAPKRKQKVQE